MTGATQQEKFLKQKLEQAQALSDADQLDEASYIYKELFDLNQDNVDVLFGMAEIVSKRGKLKQAVLLFEKILKLKPGDAGAYTKAGILYLRLGREDWAKDYFESAISNDPSYLPAYNNLGIILLQKERLQEVEQVCLQGLEKDDEYAPLYSLLGLAKHNMGHSIDAIEAFDKAIKFGDQEELAEYYSNLAIVYMYMADKKNSAKYFEKALENNPAHVHSYYSLSFVHKYKENDPYLKKMLSMLDNVGKRSEKASKLHSALGRAYNDIGDFDEAFSHYAQANYIKRSHFKFQIKDVGTLFSKTKKAFKDADVKAIALQEKDISDADISPIFIVGMPRSGTSLVEQIISAHPDVGAAGERSYLQDEEYKGGFWSVIEDAHSLSEVSKEQLLAIRKAYLDRLKPHAPEYKIITDKMPTNFRLVGLMRLAFPDAKVIHCKRDPMDTCFSIFKHMFVGLFPFSYDQKELGQYYKYYEDLMSFWSSSFPDYVYDLRYEDLVSDQEEITGQLLNFCDLNWSNQCLNFYQQDRAVLTASALQVKKPIYKSGIGSWKKYEKHLGLLKKELI